MLGGVDRPSTLAGCAASQEVHSGCSVRLRPGPGRIGDRLGSQISRRLQAMLTSVRLGCDYVHTPIRPGMIDNATARRAEADFFPGCRAPNNGTSPSLWRYAAEHVQVTGLVPSPADAQSLTQTQVQTFLRLRQAVPLPTHRLAHATGAFSVAVHVRRGDLSWFTLDSAASRWTPDRYYLDLLPRIGRVLAEVTGAPVHFHVVAEAGGSPDEWAAKQLQWKAALQGHNLHWHFGHILDAVAIMANADLFVPGSSGLSRLSQFYSLGVSLLPQRRRAPGDLRLQEGFLPVMVAHVLPPPPRCTCRSMEAIWRLRNETTNASNHECRNELCSELARRIAFTMPDEFDTCFGCALWCAPERFEAALDLTALRGIARQMVQAKRRLHSMARSHGRVAGAAGTWAAVWALIEAGHQVEAINELLRFKRAIEKLSGTAANTTQPVLGIDSSQAEDQPGRWHGQVGQDRAVAAILGYKRNGYFVDLAANDYVRFSNTRALERDYGWSGLCIEPNPRYHDRHQAVRTCRLLKFAVADIESALPFRDAGEFGGLISPFTDNKPGPPGGPTVFQVRTVRFETVLSHFHDIPRRIDYLSLDVEGAEERVMSSFPFHRYRISLLTVERPKPVLVSLLNTHGYSFLCQSGGFGDQLWIDSLFDLNQAMARTARGLDRCNNVTRCEFLWWPGWQCPPR